MPIVPFTKQMPRPNDPAGLGTQPKPSPTDLAIAFAMMHQEGKFDPPKAQPDGK